MKTIGFLVGNDRWSNVTETRGSTVDCARAALLDTVNWSRFSREMTARWTSSRPDTLTSANLYSYTGPLIHMIRFVASLKLTYFLYPVDLCDIVYVAYIVCTVLFVRRC